MSEPEECYRCGWPERDGQWVETLRATHESPAEFEWLCYLCIEATEEEDDPDKERDE